MSSCSEMSHSSVSMKIVILESSIMCQHVLKQSSTCVTVTVMVCIEITNYLSVSELLKSPITSANCCWNHQSLLLTAAEIINHGPVSMYWNHQNPSFCFPFFARHAVLNTYFCWTKSLADSLRRKTEATSVVARICADKMPYTLRRKPETTDIY